MHTQVEFSAKHMGIMTVKGQITGVQAMIERGDLFVVPSWTEYELTSGDGLDLFRFSDAPIFEALGLYRIQAGRR